MKALVRDRYGTPDVLEVRDVDTPAPGEGEVLVRVHASSLNTADLDYLRGVPRVVRLGTGLLRPRNGRLGFDVAGTVEAVGQHVTRLRPGDEVWADLSMGGPGAFAEWVCAPQDVFSLKPAGATFEEAATMPHSAVLALQGLHHGRLIRPGHRVVINGAGGCVGPFAVQIAKSLGAEVTAVDDAGKLEMLRTIGADHVIDYTIEDFTRNGQRYDHILDIAGRRSVMGYRRSLTPTGTYVMIAHSLMRFFGAALLGALLSMRGKRMGIFMWQPNKKEDLEYLAGLLVTGELRPRIDRSYQLLEVPEALRYLDLGQTRGKIVITV